MTPGGPSRAVDPGARDEQAEARNVHALAFGAGERVPLLVDALRAAKAALPPLSFVATIGAEELGFRAPTLRYPRLTEAVQAA
jgi:putative acetyltransferase